MVSRDPLRGLEVEGLTEEEKEALVNEKAHKWRHPWMLYWLSVMCSLGAATQGMDESVNNGAVAVYPQYLGFAKWQNATIWEGLVVGAPYLACAVLGCWLNEPMNREYSVCRSIDLRHLLTSQDSSVDVVPSSSLASSLLWRPFGKVLSILGVTCLPLDSYLGSALEPSRVLCAFSQSFSICEHVLQTFADLKFQSSLRCRVRAGAHSRCLGHAVAGLDGLRNHAW